MEMNDQGFDGFFLAEVPDYLKCVVCQFVLKEPVQITKCGHRFCAACFDRLKEHAAAAKQEPCCPIDRDVVDLRNTFQDTGISRVISNLQVKCRHSEHGCSWVGDLKDSTAHEEDCHCGKGVVPRNPSASLRPVATDNPLDDLRCRLNKIENDAMTKDKEILRLKDDVHSWERKYANLERELQQVCSFSEDYKKRCEKDNEVHTLRNNLLENRLKSLEDRLPESRKGAEVMNKKIKELILVSQGGDQKIRDVGDGLDAVNREVQNLNQTINNVKIQGENCSIKTNNIHKFIIFFVLPLLIVCIALSCQHGDTTETKKELAFLSHAISTLENMYLANATETKKELAFLGHAISSLENMYLANTTETKKELSFLSHAISSLENLYLAETGGRPRANVTVQWKIHGFQQLAGIGERVYSPVFHSQLKDYSFRIWVQWTGDEKDKVGIFFRLLRSKDTPTTEDLPQHPPILLKIQVIGVGENVMTKTISDEVYRKFKETCYTIGRGKMKAAQGHGWKEFLNAQILHKYLVHDTLTIRVSLLTRLSQ